MAAEGCLQVQDLAMAASRRHFVVVEVTFNLALVVVVAIGFGCHALVNVGYQGGVSGKLPLKFGLRKFK